MALKEGSRGSVNQMVIRDGDVSSTEFGAGSASARLAWAESGVGPGQDESGEYEGENSYLPSE